MSRRIFQRRHESAPAYAIRAAWGWFWGTFGEYLFGIFIAAAIAAALFL